MQGSAEYWKAATALISYRSILDPQANQLQSVNDMKSCVTEHPQSTVAKSVPAGATQLEVNAQVYVGCELQLDSADAAQIASRTVVQMVKFEHCRIIYRGSAIPIPVRSVPSTPFQWVFTDCFFDVSSPGVPPERARTFLADLLGSRDLNSAVISVGG